jgi:hypothetical protein
MVITLTVDGWCVFCQFFLFLLVSQALNKNKFTVHVSLPLEGHWLQKQPPTRASTWKSCQGLFMHFCGDWLALDLPKALYALQPHTFSANLAVHVSTNPSAALVQSAAVGATSSWITDPN